ncbi:hypothetical protein TNCV_3305181 [Trichonephila clavipes]|nr:hypothetical protein TNCV_3305181 [Trichonephila clavipes]
MTTPSCHVEPPPDTLPSGRPTHTRPHQQSQIWNGGTLRDPFPSDIQHQVMVVMHNDDIHEAPIATPPGSLARPITVMPLSRMKTTTFAMPNIKDLPRYGIEDCFTVQVPKGRLLFKCGFAADFIISPFLSRKSHRRVSKTVSAACQQYVALLQNNIISELQAQKALQTVTFIQDGVPIHIALPVKRLLRSTFGKDRISSHYLNHA